MFFKLTNQNQWGIYVVFLFLSFNNVALTQSWVGNGPFFKNIKVVTQSPTNPNIIYSGAFGWGVFKSTDGGTTWTNYKTGMINTHVRAILALSDTVVYVGTNDGVFKTTNGGTTWTLSLSTIHSIRSIAYDSKTGSLYAASYGVGLFKSTNLGNTWTQFVVTDPITAETMPHLWSVAVYGRDSLYVGGSILDITTGGGGALFKSNDGGASWTQVQNPTGIRSSVKSIAISQNSPDSSLIIGTAAKGVYKSTNAGTNWSEINAGTTPNPILDLKINTVAFTSKFRYAGTDSLGKFYYRPLGDISNGWSSGIGLPGNQAVINDIDVNPVNNNILYVGTDGKGVYRSIDSGFNWQSWNTGMLGTAGRNIKLNSNGNLILGTDFGDGIWISSNQAASWLRADTLKTSNSITAIALTNVATTIYAGDYGTGIYKSIDGGHVWHITDSVNINHFIRSLAVHPSNPDLVYAGTGNGVFKTVNGGTSWTSSSTGIPANISIRALDIDQTNPNLIYAGTDSNYLYKSIDAGASWTQVTNGFLTQDKFVRTITIDHILPNMIYIGSDSGRIYKSVNNGNNWNLLFTLPTVHSVRSILIDPSDRKTLFAGTFGDGIFVSIDSGAHWTTYNNGLPDLEIYSLESDNASPLNLFAGTGSHGVFHTTYNYVNRPPVLTPIGNKFVFWGKQLSFTVSAIDSDGTIPILSATGLPSGAIFTDSLNGKGLFQWTPTFGQVGNHSITFKASDGSLIDSEVVNVNVINRAPNIAPIGNKNVIALQHLSFNISAIDSDGTIPTLSISNKPSGASFVDSLNGHGSFNWTPSLSQVGIYAVKFYASDGALTDSQQITINVLDTATSVITNIQMDAGWNLISVPIDVGDFRRTTLFPSATSFAFGFSSSYVTKDTLKIGSGYWLKYPNSSIVELGGAKVLKDTVNVNQSWNLIGSLHVPVPVGNVVPISSLTISSRFFAYVNGVGYQIVDTLTPGKGFWVKVNQIGSIIISEPGILLSKNTVHTNASLNQNFLSSDRSINEITFIDKQNEKRSIYFSSSNHNIDVDQNELPPVPPNNIFDVRFASQRIVEKFSESIPTNLVTFSGEEPIQSITWDVRESSEYVLTVVYDNNRSQEYKLSGKGTSVIASSNISRFILHLSSSKSAELPSEFNLEQNYPNPFNPSTNISYGLPQTGRVKLSIYNILGQEVATLYDGIQERGYKQVQWNADGATSGLYIIRLQVLDPETSKLLFQSAKKMVLMK